ncbi:MAG: signal peptide peptidase SppA [Polyangiaceae bacterium]|nr:signal peptide peptidase SppA [Polyangiaceae bacterium]
MIFALLANLLRVLLLPLSALRRARAAPRRGYVALEIHGRVVDLTPPRPPLLRRLRAGAPPLSIQRVRELGQELAKDARPAGLLLVIRSVRGGPAVLASLREAIAAIRDGGKDVVAYLPQGADNAALHVASAASAIVVGPETTVAPLGFAVEGRYVRRALEQAGVEAEVFARGMYKNAGEGLVRESMSDAQREQVSAILEGRFGDLAAALAEGRRVTREMAGIWIDGAPYAARDALKIGLVDAVAYEDELERILADRAGAPRRLRLVGAGRYLRARRAARLARVLPRPVLGVVEVHGPIVSRARWGGGRLAAEDRLVASLRAARQSPRVRGVILHVDSPGGSALASDRIHHEVERLAEEKPVVAYLSDVAASGGYYVAAGAHAIVAQPQTVTGSIGVITARFALGPLLERLGVSTDVVKRGARADLFSPVRRLDEAERAVIQRELDAFYATFLGVVARGRRRPVEEIEPLAGGRVWSGAEAKARGLVDELGGFERAVDELRRRLGPRADGLEPVVLRAAGSVAPTPVLPAPVASLLAALGLAPLGERLSVALCLEGDRVLAYCPDAVP